MVSSGLAKFGICCFSILFIVAAGLVGGSFQIVEPLEYALLQNTLSKEVNAERVYTSGRYFTGLARTFVRFPRARSSIVFASGGDGGAIAVTTSADATTGGSGTQISFECVVQYSLDPTKLYDLYRLYGTNYRPALVTTVSSTIKTALTGMPLTSFYQQRANLTAIATAALQPVMQNTYKVNFEAFQIRALTIASSVNDNLIESIVNAQRQLTQTNSQQQNITRSQYDIKVGTLTQDLLTYTNKAQQDANVILQSAVADAESTRIRSSGDGYAALKNQVGFDSTELLRYLALKQVRTLPSSSVVAVGFDTVAALNSQPPA